MDRKAELTRYMRQWTIAYYILFVFSILIALGVGFAVAMSYYFVEILASLSVLGVIPVVFIPLEVQRRKHRDELDEISSQIPDRT